MRIGVPAEPSVGSSTLVSATPTTVSKLVKLGYSICVESGAGARATFPDRLYSEAGADIVGREEVWASNIVSTMDPPGESEIALMRPGSTLISRLAPGRHPEMVDRLRQAGITALAMDIIPRISRAQSMDVLSSQANIAGYRAVVEAAHAFGRLFTGQVTAAGKVPPATVYVIGAGVAGLAAIGTASAMGAIVKATDVRPEVADQVTSMGGQFVAIPAPQQESSDGYAKEMTEEQAQAAGRLYATESAHADIVITTANVPGKKSPLLLTAGAVAAMKPGSVIVDMAAGNGGNCELTRAGEAYTTENGVTIVGYTDLAGRLPAQASQLYGQNVLNFLKHATPGKDGNLGLDQSDEIIRHVTVTIGGQTTFPPPPVQVSAEPRASSVPHAKDPQEAAAAEANTKRVQQQKKLLWGGLAAVLLGALVLITPAAIASHYIVLALAVIVGFYVITNVTHALHTPLMSVTNAISGIIVVGAILQVGSDNIAVKILSFLAIVVASINVFGGFTVTHRMLNMFRKA